MQCLDYWLRYSNGSAYAADLVYFNFGLHDGPQLFNAPPANVTIPGQEGNMTVYAPELTEIATRLKAYAFLSFFFFVSILSYFCSILLLLLSFFFFEGGVQCCTQTLRTCNLTALGWLTFVFLSYFKVLGQNGC